jgi:hypothetical protein
VALEIAGGVRSPGLAHQHVRIGAEIALEQTDQLVRRTRVVEWPDQGLHDAGAAVDGAQVAPGFERVRHRQPPLATPRRLVVGETKMSAERRLADQFTELERARRGIGGIAVHNNECVNAPGAEIVGEFLQ